MIAEGAPAPDFELRDDQGSTVKLSDLRGKSVVLYFYPKDDTLASFYSIAFVRGPTTNCQPSASLSDWPGLATATAPPSRA